MNASGIGSFYAAKFAAGFRFIATRANSDDGRQFFFKTEDDVVEFAMDNAVSYLASFNAAGELTRERL